MTIYLVYQYGMRTKNSGSKAGKKTAGQRSSGAVSQNVRSYVHKAINRNHEMKSLYTAVSAANVSYDTGTLVSCLSVVSQDKSAHQREGNLIRPQRLEILWEADRNTDMSRFRIIVIQWRKDNALTGGSPGISISASTNTIVTGSGGSGSEHYAPYFLEYEPYYKVLYDRRFEFNDTYQYLKQGRIVIKGQKMANIVFNEDALTTGKQHLYILVTSDKTAASSLGPAFRALARFNFKE